ncbi:Delta(3,5)-Delta(2,4)-dienoyl-CoA isomerase [Beauveria bassiana D1-5]|uniref:Delta(3,5)-Delta(2,4)-dienoyl-CoA isomerase n=1 Tax=Beauveria bassiana D1-5 TaxID=1245745 RepID=A0A0A2VSC8_BEABA|nr:Delta(3,5)-Delta(2,4)-dienoyl-CoA isomerase [Beauveria bassiana D1-5]
MSVVPAYESYQYMRVTSPAEYVAHVEINNPKRLNAFSQAVWLEYGRVFEQISVDAQFRVAVLSGVGDRAFTSGLDVKAAAGDSPLTTAEGDEVRRAKLLRNHIEEFQTSISAMEKCEKPVIAVLHDVAIGLAIDIATKSTLAWQPTFGTLARLPKVVGSLSWVKDVCMTARDFDAAEALAQGFVSQVHADKAKAVEAGLGLAALLASKSPVAVQGTKELLNYGKEHSVADSLRYTQVWNSVALQGEDFVTAMMSSMQKKKPTFSKL